MCHRLFRKHHCAGNSPDGCHCCVPGSLSRCNTRDLYVRVASQLRRRVCSAKFKISCDRRRGGTTCGGRSPAGDQSLLLAPACRIEYLWDCVRFGDVLVVGTGLPARRTQTNRPRVSRTKGPRTTQDPSWAVGVSGVLAPLRLGHRASMYLCRWSADLGGTAGLNASGPCMVPRLTGLTSWNRAITSP
jgi:hypothetical protein